MGARIVVAHDELDSLQRMSAALRKAGYDVVEFTDPMNALSSIEGADPVAALVTRTEFGPGTLNGIALARLARGRQPDIKLVFVGLSQHRPHTVGLGEFVPMPIEAAAIVATVDRLLADAPTLPPARDHLAGRGFSA